MSRSMIARVGLLLLLAMFTEPACHSIVGIEDRCAERCADDRTRVVCGSDAEERREPCAESAPFCLSGACASCRTDADCDGAALEGACEKTVCDGARGCTVVARRGEACGQDGTCRGYACIGSDTTLALSESTSCARTSDGFVWCWGDGTLGQLGDARTGARSVPYLVSRIGPELGPARAVSVGYGHACAILEDGRLLCWGNNLAAQANGREPSPTSEPLGPTLVEGLARAEAVVTGYGHTCVSTAEGGVTCWGRNVDGECGVGREAAIVPQPTEVGGLGGPISAITTAKTTTCATNRTDIFCWGENLWGQLGPNVAADAGRLPVKVQGIAPGGVLQVAASWSYVCAVVSTNAVVQCWGNDRWGQLGRDRADGPWGPGVGDAANPVPRFVVDAEQPEMPLGAVGAIFLGTGSHLCARSSIYVPDFLCWGENGDSEVGVPARVSPIPRPVRAPYLRGALRVAPGDDHTCMLRREADGFDVSCWGEASAGQVGDGLAVSPPVQREPAPVRWPDLPGGLAAVRAAQ